jgi:eukaryotic-like serine/threonine-protein kinase
MPSATGNRLLGGRYRLGEPLGRGGMGVVWAGRDEALGREVAIKEVVPPLDLTPDDRETLRRRTLREARAAARISSSAAVSVYDVVEEDGRPWIVMERLAARSLADVLRDDGPLSARRTVEVGLDILDALQAAAAVGVLHRDVKPANVMLRPHGRAVLTDFGIATVEDDATVTTTGLLRGSPAYMSPERARGERSTLASDLWSLGATLYAALEGRPPFERSGTLPTLHAVLHDPAPSLVHRGDLGDVICSLLVKEPSGRPSLPEVRSALQRVLTRDEGQLLALGGTATTAGGGRQSAIASWLTGPAARTSAMPRRRDRRILSGLVVVGLLMTLGLIGLGAFYDWPSPRTNLPQADADPGGRSEPTSAESPRPTADAAVNQPPVSPPANSDQPSTAPTASKSAASAPEAAPVPADFRLHSDPTGFTVAVPDGWARSTEGSRTYFKEPGGGRFLLVDQTTEPKDDPLADWQANEPSVASRLSGYERISLDRVEYRGWDTADWEFTWQGSRGQIHVLNRNVRVSDERAYALYWSTPEAQWADSRAMFDVIAQSFQSAG